MQTENASDEFVEALGEVDTERAAAMAVQCVAANLAAAAAVQQEIEGITLADRVPVEKQFHSIGGACSLIGIPPQRFRELAKAVGAEPAMAINDIVHYDGHAVLAVWHKLRDMNRTEQN